MRRLLPWAGDEGQPCYLDTDDEGSFVSCLADELDAVQLGLAERLLDRAESAWTERPWGVETSGLVPHLCHAMRDTLRVAWSLRGRLPTSQTGVRRSRAGAVVAREFALSQGEVVQPGPRAVWYRWPGAPRYVAAARHTLRRHLHAWGMTELRESAELVLTELAGNAVRHACVGEDQPFETRFEPLADGGLRIEVFDGKDPKPEQREPSPDGDSGRGLALVDALTSGRWGVGERAGVGRCVWCTVYVEGAGGEVS